MRVTVVIPTYDEAGSIARVLDEIPASLVTEVLVIDAGSTDGTQEIAAAHGARVIVEPRRGYGRACLTGLAAANNPDTVVFLDGDYSDRPRELGRLIDPIREGRADVVLGSRLAGGLVPGAMLGYRVIEVPVSYHPRIGVSKISGTLRGSIGAAWCILAGILRNRLRAATSPAEPGPAS